MHEKKVLDVEGKIMREQIVNDREKIERIKAEKMKELGQMKIPDKFKVDLAKRKIT